MLGKKFRPWGQLDWILKKSPALNWSLLGSVSFEHRCTALQEQMTDYGIHSLQYIDIVPPVGPGVDEQAERLRENRKLLIANGVGQDQIVQFRLLERAGSFMKMAQEFVQNSNGDVILDISCLPKRYFFPILKILVKSPKVHNLLLTYTKPEEYSNGKLAKDPAEWKHLPGFMNTTIPEPHAELAIVGVGFVPLGLSSLLTGKYKDAEVKLLFPYPPGPPNYQRNWGFVSEINRKHPSRTDVSTMNRVHTLNLSDAFDQICALTNDGVKYAILAPYGPKPISAAMALYSIAYEVPVVYTQPTSYAPDYSSGIKETYAYWIKKEGLHLYGKSI